MSKSSEISALDSTDGAQKNNRPGSTIETLAAIGSMAKKPWLSCGPLAR